MGNNEMKQMILEREERCPLSDETPEEFQETITSQGPKDSCRLDLSMRENGGGRRACLALAYLLVGEQIYASSEMLGRINELDGERTDSRGPSS